MVFTKVDVNSGIISTHFFIRIIFSTYPYPPL